MELLNEKDFKGNIGKEVYSVLYTDKLKTGILPLADNIASNPDFDARQLFSNSPQPEKYILNAKEIVNEYPICSTMITYTLEYEDKILTAVNKGLQQTDIVYAAIYEYKSDKLRSESFVGKERDIHIFTTYDECAKYVDECNKKILNNLLSYYDIKLNQYTAVVNKLTEHFKV